MGHTKRDFGHLLLFVLLWHSLLHCTVMGISGFRYQESSKQEGNDHDDRVTKKPLMHWQTDSFLGLLDEQSRFQEIARTAEGLNRIRKCEKWPESEPYKPEDYLGELHSMYVRYWENREHPAKKVMRGGIPQIIHQSWKSKDIPAVWMEWQQSWLLHNPDFEYHLWTDEGNREFVALAYPWFLCTYDGFPEHIMRVDAVRVLYMHWFGGVYVDLDTVCLKPFRTLLEEESGALVAQMGDDPQFSSAYPNAWFASEPNHPFWLYAALKMQQRYFEGTHTERTTGPDLIKDAVECWPSVTMAKWAKPLSIIPPRVIYPVDWHVERPEECWPHDLEHKPFDVAKCAFHFPEAYSMTFWQHSWGRRLIARAEQAAGATVSHEGRLDM